MHSQMSYSVPSPSIDSLGQPSCKVPVDTDGIRVSSQPPFKQPLCHPLEATRNEPIGSEQSCGITSASTKDGIRVYSAEFVDRLDVPVVERATISAAPPSAAAAATTIRDDGIRVRGSVTTTTLSSSGASTRTCLEIDPVTGLQAGHPALQPLVRRPKPNTKRNSKSKSSSNSSRPIKATVPQRRHTVVESSSFSAESSSSSFEAPQAPTAPIKSNSAPPLTEIIPVESIAGKKPKQKKGLLSKLSNIIRSRSNETLPIKSKTKHGKQAKQPSSREGSSLELSRDVSSHELVPTVSTAAVAAPTSPNDGSDDTKAQPTSSALLVAVPPSSPSVTAVPTPAPAPTLASPLMALNGSSSAATKERGVPTTTEVVNSVSSIVASSTPRPFLGSNPSIRSVGQLDRSNHSYHHRQQSPRSMSSDHSRRSQLQTATEETVTPTTATAPPPPSRVNSFRSTGEGSSMRRAVPRRTTPRSDSCSTLGLDQSDRSRSRLGHPPPTTTSPPLPVCHSDSMGGLKEDVPRSVTIERPSSGPKQPDLVQNYLELQSSSDHGVQSSQRRLNSMAFEDSRGLIPSHARPNSTVTRQPGPMGHPSMMRQPFNSSGSLAPHPMQISKRHSFHSDPRGGIPQHAMAPMGRSLSAVYPGQSHGQRGQMYAPQSQENFVWANPPSLENGCPGCPCCLGQMNQRPVGNGYGMGAPVRSLQPRPLPAPHGFPNQRGPTTSATTVYPRPIHSLASHPANMGCKNPQLNSPKGRPMPIMHPSPLLNDPRVFFATRGQAHPSTLRRSSALNSPKGGPKPMLPGQLRNAPVNDPRTFVPHGQPHRDYQGNSSAINSPKGGPKPMLPGPSHSAPVNDQPHPVKLRRSSSLHSPKGGPKTILPAPPNNVPVNDPRAFVAYGQPRRTHLGNSNSVNSRNGGPKPMTSGSLHSAPAHHDSRAILAHGQPHPVNLRCPSSLNVGLNPMQTDSRNNAPIMQGRSVAGVYHGQQRELSQPHYLTSTGSTQQRPAHNNVPMGIPARGLTRSMSFVAPRYTPQHQHADMDGQSVASFRSSRPRGLVRSSSVILSSSNQHLGYLSAHEATTQLVPGHSTGFRPRNGGARPYLMSHGASSAASLGMGNRTPMPLRQDQPMLRRTPQPMSHSNSFGTMSTLERTQNISGRGGPVAAYEPNGTFHGPSTGMVAQHDQF